MRILQILAVQIAVHANYNLVAHKDQEQLSTKDFNVKIVVAGQDQLNQKKSVKIL
jgi:hypothetical protein